MQDFFIKYTGKINKQNVAEFIQLSNEENISVEEIILPLLSFLDVHHVRSWSRSRSEGGGRVKNIDLWKDSMKIQTWDDEEFEFTYERGFRWRTQQGWV